MLSLSLYSLRHCVSFICPICLFLCHIISYLTCSFISSASCFPIHSFHYLSLNVICFPLFSSSFFHSLYFAFLRIVPFLPSSCSSLFILHPHFLFVPVISRIHVTSYLIYSPILFAQFIISSHIQRSILSFFLLSISLLFCHYSFLFCYSSH